MGPDDSVLRGCTAGAHCCLVGCVHQATIFGRQRFIVLDAACNWPPFGPMVLQNMCSYAPHKEKVQFTFYTAGNDFFVSIFPEESSFLRVACAAATTLVCGVCACAAGEHFCVTLNMLDIRPTPPSKEEVIDFSSQSDQLIFDLNSLPLRGGVKNH